MTLLYAVHNVLPPLVGFARADAAHLERVDASERPAPFFSAIAVQLTDAVDSGMLGVAGVRRVRAAASQPGAGRGWRQSSASRRSSSTGCSPAARRGSTSPSASASSTIFILTIVRAGLLSAVAALFTHFVLLRAPITTDFSSWHATTGLWHVGVVLALRPRRLLLRAQRRRRTRHDFLTWTRIGVPISPNDSRSWFDEKPLVREVKLRRDVREEHERRRGHARLRRVENAHVPLAGADWRVRGGHALQKAVELAGRDAAHARVGDLVDRLEHLGRALAGCRRNMKHRRVVEELDLPPQLVVELLARSPPRALSSGPICWRR